MKEHKYDPSTVTQSESDGKDVNTNIMGNLIKAQYNLMYHVPYSFSSVAMVQSEGEVKRLEYSNEQRDGFTSGTLLHCRGSRREAFCSPNYLFEVNVNLTQ